MCLITDLSATTTMFLADKYSTRGPQPRDPASMLRSYLLFLLTRPEIGITDWVNGCTGILSTRFNASSPLIDLNKRATKYLDTESDMKISPTGIPIESRIPILNFQLFRSFRPFPPQNSESLFLAKIEQRHSFTL
jgi:hypothetical protein